MRREEEDVREMGLRGDGNAISWGASGSGSFRRMEFSEKDGDCRMDLVASQMVYTEGERSQT